MSKSELTKKPKIIVTTIAKQPDHIDNKNSQFLAKSSQLNWKYALIADLQYILELFKQTPINYSFEDINTFLTEIKSYIHPDLTYYEYQYLLRIFVHKVHDDHTSVQFYDPIYMYSGFTATCELKQSTAIQRYDTILGVEDLISKNKQTLNTKDDNMERFSLNSEIDGQGSTVKNKLKDGKSLQILKLDDIDDILQRLVVKVDIVNSDYLFGILKSGDQIVLINREPVLKYLKRVAVYSQRNTNFIQYNMMKQALTLGIMNYLFPVKSITIQRKGELVKIKLKYTKLNKLITFHTGTVDVEFKLYTKMKLGYNPNTNKLPEFQLSQIDKQSILIVYPRFTLDYHNKIKEINILIQNINKSNTQSTQTSKDNRNKTKISQQALKLIIIDLRSNRGGDGDDCFQLIDLILQTMILPGSSAKKTTIDQLNIKSKTKSRSKEFARDEFDKSSAKIYNSSLSDIKKKEQLHQITSRYQKLLKLIKQNKSLYQFTYEYKPLDIINQLESGASLYLEDKIPGIVLITNDTCKSSCSIFVHTLKICPQVILIGSDVQGFNDSGKCISFKLPSLLGQISVPNIYGEFPLTELYKQTAESNLYIHSNIIPKSLDKQCKWISKNKLYFNQLILQQCKDFKQQYKDQQQLTI